MRAPAFLVACAMFVALTACSSGSDDNAFGKTDVDSIHKMLQEFTTAYNAKDAKQVAAAFSGMGTVLPPNAATVRGRETVEQYYIARFAEGASGLELEAKDVTGHGDLAVANGDYRLVMASPGGPERRDRGKFLFVLRDYDGQWRLEYLMFSSDFAASRQTS